MEIRAAPGRIGGVVVLAESGAPLSTAFVTVRSAADSLVVAGSLTAADGRFRVEGLPIGRYLLRVHLMGFKPVVLPEQTLTRDAPVLDVGTVRLEIDAVKLQELDIKAEPAQVRLKAEGTVYDMKDRPGASGSTIDVLRNVPELEVDMRGRVTIRGGQGVAIHINGRPAPFKGESLTGYLQQMPGGRITRIEVMANPSARHDPEGMGGIVNIVMRETLPVGLSGSAQVSISTLLDRALAGRLNFQRGGLTVFSGASVQFQNQEATNYDLRENLMVQPISYLEQTGIARNDHLQANADVTAELQVAAQSYLWSTLMLNHRNHDTETLTRYGIMDGVHTLLERYDRTNRGELQFGTTDLAVGFKRAFGKNHEFTVDVRRTGTDTDHANRLTMLLLLEAGRPLAPEPQPMLRQEIGAGNAGLSLQADYTRPLGAGRFDFGVRLLERDQDEDNWLGNFENEQARAARSNAESGFQYRELFRTAYAMYGTAVGRLSLQLGARAELANTEFQLRGSSNVTEQDYNSLFPSASFSYEIAAGRTLQASYSKRISRPFPDMLNPYVPTLDPLNISIGNPNLRPNYAHQLQAELALTGRRGALRLQPSYSRIVDNWDRVRTVDATGVSTITWENVAQSEYYGASVLASLRPVNGLGGSVSIGAFREVRDASNLSTLYSQSALRWTASANATYRVNPTLIAGSTVRYNPAYSLVQGRVSGVVQSSITARQTLWSGKGALEVRVYDPFDVYRFRFETRDVTHIQNSRLSQKLRMLSLGLSYNFGKAPEQNSRRQEDPAAAPSSLVR